MAVAKACQGCKGENVVAVEQGQPRSAPKGSLVLKANLLHHPGLRVPGGKCVSVSVCLQFILDYGSARLESLHQITIFHVLVPKSISEDTSQLLPECHANE